MTTPSWAPLPARRAVLADVLTARLGASPLARDAALVAAAAGLTGLAAQVAIPLPFTPVPLTMQTFAVLVTAAALGWARGLASMALYALLGMAGVPWFAEGASGVGGPTFGYVVGFVLAAGVVGAVARRGATRTAAGTALAMVAGTLAVYAVGVPWLAATTPLDLAGAAYDGAVVFLAGDAVKALAAAGLLPAAWALVERAHRR
ncbi:biotin transporter BioY [Vallicoccus soli]|uniref:Biotin transporter n=1 Tax=Vallicoccus soli TaxID=2339232 RepID=A0A3A3YTL1_9ACTN|nr:biotin transporter BioY [Vallicoccus soli]RJK94814.1 biotin transporter BioY [Vallicoccus soli]